MTQFRGTQFSFGGGWVEPTYSIDQPVGLPLAQVMPLSGSFGTPGSAIGNIGVTQDISALGMPATLGIGFLTNAGVGTDFRGIPASNGTSSYYVALDAGWELASHGDSVAVHAKMASGVLPECESC